MERILENFSNIFSAFTKAVSASGSLKIEVKETLETYNIPNKTHYVTTLYQPLYAMFKHEL